MLSRVTAKNVGNISETQCSGSSSSSSITITSTSKNNNNNNSVDGDHSYGCFPLEQSASVDRQ